MKKLIKKLFALLGIKISRINKNAEIWDLFIIDPFKMQKHLTKKLTGDIIIFDLGAYVGDTALDYKNLFPKSKIYCFEPFPDSFLKLEKNTSAFKDIIAINKGVGEEVGFAKFNSNKSATTNSLLETHELGSSTWGAGLLDTIRTIKVELTTIDNFVETHGIEKIDILKMDVQGAESKVIYGAKQSLEKGIINMIYTEILILPTYKEQLHFDEMINLMRSFGFKLFNLYNYSLTDEGELRQVDAIFLKSTPHNKK